ncbi:MAG: hypothetical protein R3C03_04885 [Pirellulaceae bacterium]
MFLYEGVIVVATRIPFGIVSLQGGVPKKSTNALIVVCVFNALIDSEIGTDLLLSKRC